MKKLVETVLENRSTKEVFLFRIPCACCGSEYGNQPIRFSRAGEPAATAAMQLLQAALYEEEMRTVRQTAIGKAAEALNLCPVCRQLVCNRCFMICDELDMCRDCAEKLQQKGQPVMSGSPPIIMAAMQ